MSDDPMDDLNKLAKRVNDVLVAEGLILMRFAAVAGDEPCIEMMVGINHDYRKPDEFDDLLGGIEEATRLAEIERKADEARAGLVDLQDQLKHPKDGIL